MTDFKRWQTVILGMLAFTAFMVSAVTVFEVDSRQLLYYFLAAALLIAMLIVSAFLSVLLMRLLRGRPRSKSRLRHKL